MNLSLKSVNYVTYVFQYYNVLLPWYMLRKRWYMVLFNVLRKRMSKKNNTPENFKDKFIRAVRFQQRCIYIYDLVHVYKQ
jgi:hypothetical protein